MNNNDRARLLERRRREGLHFFGTWTEEAVKP